MSSTNLTTIEKSQVFHYPYSVDWGVKKPNVKPSHSTAGDCFILPYRNHDKRRYDYILLDSGHKETYTFNVISNMLDVLNAVNKGGVITGIIITHIDIDHCGGVASLLSVIPPIYSNVNWIAVGMIYVSQPKISRTWRNFSNSLTSLTGWGMEKAKRDIIPPSTTKPTIKEFNDAISRRIFCSTNGQIVVRCWNLIGELNEGLHFYYKAGSAPLFTPNIPSSLTTSVTPLESVELIEHIDQAFNDPGFGPDPTPSPVDIEVDPSPTNKSSITTHYCSYPILGRGNVIQKNPQYYCFNGDSLFYFSRLLTGGLPHNHEFATKLFENMIPSYPFNISTTKTPVNETTLRTVYDAVYTIDIHYKFHTFYRTINDDAKLVLAMQDAGVPAEKRTLVKEYVTKFNNLTTPSLIPFRDICLNNWDAYQLCHHGSINNSVGLSRTTELHIIKELPTLTNYAAQKTKKAKLSGLTRTTIMELYKDMSSVFFVTSAGTDNHMATLYIQAFKDDAFKSSKILVNYPSKIKESGKLEHVDGTNDSRFSILCNLAMYVFWNFAPIFPILQCKEYDVMQKITRAAYGCNNGMQIFKYNGTNSYEHKTYLDRNYNAIKKEMGILKTKVIAKPSVWDKLAKHVVSKSSYPLPPIPKKTPNVPKQINGTSSVQAAEPRRSSRIKEQTPKPDPDNSSRVTILNTPITLADWLDAMWSQVDTIDFTIYSSTTFQPAVVFQSLGDVTIDVVRFFPLTLKGSDFFLDINATHDELVLSIYAHGVITHPASLTDPTLVEQETRLYLSRNKASSSDRSPLYFFTIIVDDDLIYNVLPMSEDSHGEKKTVSVLSDEIHEIQIPFPHIIYENKPSVLNYALIYDRNHSLDELTPLSKAIITEIVSLGYYIQDSQITDEITFTLHNQSDVVLSSSNVNVSFTRNLGVAGKYILRLVFGSDFQPNIDNEYFIEGSFFLEHVMIDKNKQDVLVSDLANISLFSRLKEFLPAVFTEYDFLSASFDHQLDSLLSLLSIRQFSGGFFGLITDVSSLLSYLDLTNLHLTSLESIVQFTPPNDLNIFNQRLKSISFYFQLRFEYETIYHTNPTLLSIGAHSLKLEGVINTTNGYEFTILYSFGTLSSIQVKKVKLVQVQAEPSVDIDFATIRDAFQLTDHAIVPSQISFFGNIMSYFPDFFCISLMSDYSFGGIEAKFIEVSSNPITLASNIELSDLSLGLEYFPGYNTSISAMLQFKKIPPGENESTIDSIGTFNFVYDYRYEEHSVGASLRLHSSDSIYNIIKIFVDNLDTYLDSFPVTSSTLKNTLLREISVRFNISTQSLEQFHLHIDTQEPIFILGDYLQLSSIDIRYSYSSSASFFHFQGELITIGSPVTITVCKTTNTAGETVWRVDGTSTGFVDETPSVSDLYSKLKDSDSAKSFIQAIFNTISIRIISLEIYSTGNTENDRVIFYIEVASLKLAMVYHKGKVNILSTLSIEFDAATVSNASILDSDVIQALRNGTKFIQDTDLGRLTPDLNNDKEHQQLDVCTDINLEAEIDIGASTVIKNSTCLTIDDEIISISTDTAARSTTSKCFLNNSLFDFEPNSTEKQFLGEFYSCLDTFNFLFSDSAITLGCVYLNEFDHSQVSHHEFVRKMIDDTLRDLGLVSHTTILLLALKCHSRLISGLRSSNPPSNSILTRASTSPPPNQLLFTIAKFMRKEDKVLTIVATFKTKEGQENEEQPILLGNWFKLTEIRISAEFILSTTSANLALAVTGEVRNGPSLEGDISGTVSYDGFSCNISLLIDLWAQPFSIDWLFLNFSLGGSLQIMPAVLFTKVYFSGVLYVIPQKFQAEMKAMEKTKENIEKYFAKITDPTEESITIHLKELEIELNTPTFKFDILAKGLALSRILRDIFMQDVDEIVDFSEVKIEEGAVKCDYSIGKITNVGLSGEIHIIVGDFSLFLKAGYKENEGDLEFKAVGVMPKWESFKNKVVISTATFTGVDPFSNLDEDSDDDDDMETHIFESDILDFLPDNIKDGAEFKDGPLFALSLIEKDSYFKFNGGITIFDVKAAFKGNIRTNLFYLYAKLRITDRSELEDTLVVKMKVHVNDKNFSFSSKLHIGLGFVTPDVGLAGFTIFYPTYIKILLTTDILFNVSSEGLRIAGNGSFILDLNELIRKEMEGKDIKGFDFLLLISFPFDIKLQSLNDIFDVFKKYIVDNFDTLFWNAMKEHFSGDNMELLVTLFVTAFGIANAFGIAYVLFGIGATAPQALILLAGQAATAIRDAIGQVFNIRGRAYTRLEQQTPGSDIYVPQLRLSDSFNSVRRGFESTSLLNLSFLIVIVSHIVSTNSIENTVVSNISTNLSNIFTETAQSVGHEKLFEFKTDSFTITATTSETVQKIQKLFTDCQQATTSAKYLLTELIANRIAPTEAKQRNALLNMVSRLVAYFTELQQVADVLLHNWFINEDTVLPLLLQGVDVRDGELRTLLEVVSDAIMNPFILHLEFISTLLHHLQPVISLSASAVDFFNKRIANLNCIVTAEILVSRHYNSSLLYSGLGANGTLITVNGIDCVVLDSRLHSIANVSFFKEPRKSIDMRENDDIHPFYEAIRHSSVIPTGSSLETAQLYRIIPQQDGAARYAIEIHKHLRCINLDLADMIADEAKVAATLISRTSFAPGLELYKNTSFIQGFAAGFETSQTSMHTETGEDMWTEDDAISWSCVNYEYGSIDLDSFLYPAIIRIHETNDVIFRLSPDFIFKVDPEIPSASITKLITELYQEYYTLLLSQSAFNITLTLQELPRVMIQDIKRIVTVYKPSFDPRSSLASYIQNLPIFKATSAFKVVNYGSAVDEKQRYKLIFGTPGDYFQTSFPKEPLRPRSLIDEDAYKQLKNQALSPNQNISPLFITCQPSNYDEHGNYNREMKEGVYGIDISNTTTVTVPASVTTIDANSFRNSKIEKVIFEAGSALRTIDEYAFYGCTNLKSIVIPKYVTSLNSYVFAQSGLTEITFEEGSTLKYIEKNAFNSCIGLTSITIPVSVTTIAKDAFINSGVNEVHFMPGTLIKSVFIPASVIKIEDNAFKNSGLETITFAEGSKVAMIGESAFYGCKKLTSFTIPDSVTEIKADTFGDSGLEDMIFSTKSLLTLIDTAAFFGCKSLSCIEIPKSVKTLGINAFRESNLKNITFIVGSKLETIAAGVFYDCTKLTAVKVPTFVTEIGCMAFKNSSLDAITFDKISTLTTIGPDAFFGCVKLTSITIPASVKTIGRGAFKNNIKLDNVSFDLAPISLLTALTVINQETFFGCNKLTSITIPASVNSIEDEAFKNSGLETIIFAGTSTCEAIKKSAFFGCTYLQTIEIPDSITTIGEYAFCLCWSLERVTFATAPVLREIGEYAFHDTTVLISITIPASVTTIAHSAFDNSGLMTMNFAPNTQLKTIHIPALVTTIGGTESEIGVFQDSNLETITFAPGSTLGKINANMFSGCTSLFFVGLPTYLKIIGDCAFYGCVVLGSIDIPVSLVEIGEYAFYGCVLLNSISIPASVTTINEHAFRKSGLTKVEFVGVSQVTTIESRTFSDCKSLGLIEIPASITSIGSFAFNGCDVLDSVVFDPRSQLEGIGANAFSLCPKLDKIVIPASVTAIADSAFDNSSLTTMNFEPNTQLKSITIPASVTTIGGSVAEIGAFQDSSLDTITFEDTSVLKMISTNTFSGCKQLSEISIPASVIEICEFAFSLCEKLSEITIPASVATIGRYAFSESGLSTIYFADDAILTIIRDFTFYKCIKLESITIPTSIITVEKDAFKSSGLDTMDFKPDTKIESVVIPAFVTKIADFAFQGSKLNTITFATGSILGEIGKNAFQGCSKLTSIDLPASVVEIGESAFRDSGLTEIEFDPESLLNKLGPSAFYDCKRLTKIEIPKSLALIEEYTFANSALSSITYAIGPTLSKISPYAFDNCLSLTSITIPSSITILAFEGFASSLTSVLFEPNTQIESIFIPASVTTISSVKIGEGAFKNSNLMDISFGIGSSLKMIEANTFSGCKSLRSVAIPPSVTIIGSSAFKDSNVTNVEFSKTSLLDRINNSAFDGCVNLNSISIPDSVTIIDQSAFQKSSIAQLTFTEESKLTKISDFAFNECKNLNMIYIPSSVIMIADDAFHNSGLKTLNFMPVTKLNSIFVPSSVTTIGKAAFKNSDLQFISFAPGSKLAMIDKDTFSGCKILSSVIIPASVTSVNTNAFRESGLVSVIFEGTKITTIQDYAFYGCVTLTTITIPSSVTIIANNAFDNSGLKTMNFIPFSQITSIVIPASVTKIGDVSFMSSSLSSITFASGSALETIGEAVFYDCQHLSFITLPASTTTIGQRAFMNSALKSIVFSAISKLTSIASNTFSGCMFLNSIIIPASVAVIADNAFNGSGLQTMGFEPGTKLMSIIIPASVIAIEGSVAGVGAFQNSNLGTLTFSTGSSLKTIGEKALLGCQNIASIHIPASVTRVKEGAFQESGLGEITFGEESDLVKIDKNTFYKCTHLTEIDIPKYVETIGVDAFRESGIESIRFDINSMLAIIDANAFKDCARLTSIEIPASATDIGESAFENSTLTTIRYLDMNTLSRIAKRTFFNTAQLTVVVVPASVEVIEENAFENSGLTSIIFAPNSKLHTIKPRAFFGCKNLTSITIPSSVTTIADDAFQDSALEAIDFEPNTELKSIIIPPFVTNIKDKAFANSGLEKITFAPGSVLRSIGKDAFYNCIKLISITLPATVNNIGDNTFAESGLTSIVFAKQSTLQIINSKTFYNCRRLTSIVIPNSVTTIGPRAFMNCLSLTSITIPPDVTTISDSAFNGCSSLTSFTIPPNVTTISDSVFLGCSSLTSFTIPSSVTTIEQYAFARCSSLTSIVIPSNITTIAFATFMLCLSLTSITIPSSVTKIEGQAFYCCSSLTTFTIPPNVTTISSAVFLGCSSLTSFTIPSYVTTIEWSAFASCSSLTSIVIPSNITTIAFATFRFCTSLTSITISSSVTKIEEEAFIGCSSLTSIVIPSNITTIAFATFKLCTSLTSITIPSSVTWIEDEAFYGCSSLTSMAIPSSVTMIRNAVFMHCSSLISITIPSSVPWFGFNLFYGCSSLTSITIPSSIISLGYSTFKYCSSLTSLTIPSPVVEIGYCTFYGCSSLTSITIPSSVTKIESEAFYDCSSLTSITIPSSVTRIDSRAFYNCFRLNTIRFVEVSQLKKIGDNAFGNCSSLTSITIPSSVSTIANDAFNDCGLTTMNFEPGTQLTHISIPASVTIIGDSAFEDSGLASIEFASGSKLSMISKRMFWRCKNLTSINIPASVTTIENHAFSLCVNLSGLKLPASLTTIGMSAFNTCESLLSITIPVAVTTMGTHVFSACKTLESAIFEGNHLKRIEDQTFSLCNNLAEVELPDSITSIGVYGFSSCKSLRTINIPDSVTEIGDYAFYKCVSLSGLKLPASLTTIGNYAFHTCESLRSITIPAAVTIMGAVAFNTCKLLESVVFEGAHLTRIENNTFSLCENLTEVELPDSITSIATYAFSTCKSLRSINIPASVTEIGDYAFIRCASLSGLKLPASLATIGNYAFSGCKDLLSIEIPKSVKTLGDEVFSESGLTKVTFQSDSGLKLIPVRAFYKCIDLISFNTPASVTEIQEGVFGFCKELDFILLHRSDKIKISRSAFEGVDNPPSDSQINWVD